MTEQEGQCTKNVRCPRCGETEIEAYRMGINRYRIGRNGERFDRIMPDSEDTISYHCPSCNHHSGTDAWEFEDDGSSGFMQRKQVYG